MAVVTGAPWGLNRRARTCFYNALYAGPLSELREQAAQLAAQGVGGETGASVLVVE